MKKVAIIGTGTISAAHIQAYLKFPNRCKITALCDIYPHKAEQKKEQFHLTDARVYASHEELLNSEELDLISICTPPYVHAQIAIHGLEHGVHVLVEKPMAPSLQECDQMIDAAERYRRLGVIAQNRFKTPIMKIKQILDSGLIGRPLFAQIDSLWWRGHCYYDLWWRGCWEKEGGGCTLNHAVHHIDMLGWMMGPPTHVTAVLSNAAHDNAEVEDISVAIMQYPRGTLALLTSSVIHYGEQQAIKFQGERAAIAAPWEVHASHSLENGFPTPNEELEQKLHSYYRTLPNLSYEGHTGEIDNFLTALEKDCAPLITGQDGRLTIELITAIYKSGFLHRTVELPIRADDPFYKTEGLLKHAIHFYEKSSHVENFKDLAITTGSDYSSGPNPNG